MPYNDDAREPSSVTGRALGAMALTVGTGVVGVGTAILGKKAWGMGKNAIKDIQGVVQKHKDLRQGIIDSFSEEAKKDAYSGYGNAILSGATEDVNREWFGTTKLKKEQDLISPKSINHKPGYDSEAVRETYVNAGILENKPTESDAPDLNSPRNINLSKVQNINETSQYNPEDHVRTNMILDNVIHGYEEKDYTTPRSINFKEGTRPTKVPNFEKTKK